MNKLFYYLLPLLLVAGLSACKKEKEKEPDEPKPEEVTYKLALDPHEATLYLGENITIKPTLTPAADEATFTFKSDDEDVATVSAKGVVSTGGTYGSATITVRALLGDKTVAMAKCNVDVVKDKLLLSEEEVTLLKGNSVSLKANLDKAKKEVTTECEWKSSNTNIATVKDGKIEAVDKGECDITATYDGVSSTCHVVVALDILLISETELALLEGGTATLTTKLENADKDVTSLCKWESTDANVATVDKGLVKTVGPGKCDIMATYDDQTVVCHLTVDAYLNVTPAEITINEGETQQLTANMSGVSYSSGNTSVATVSSTGLVTAKGGGQTRITATCGDMTVYVDVTVLVVPKSITSTIPSAVLMMGKQNSTTSLSIPASMVTVSPVGANIAANVEGKITWSNGSTTTFTSATSGWTASLPATGSSKLLTGTIQWSITGAGGTPLTTSQQITLLAEEAQTESNANYFGTMGLTTDVEVDILNLPSCNEATWNQYLNSFVNTVSSYSGQGAKVSVYRNTSTYTVKATYSATACGISGMKNTEVRTAVQLDVFNGRKVETKTVSYQYVTFYSSIVEHEFNLVKSAGGLLAQSYETFDLSSSNSANTSFSLGSSTYNAYKTQAVTIIWKGKYYTNTSGSATSSLKTIAEKSLNSLQNLYNSPAVFSVVGKTVTVQLKVN